MRQRRLRSKTNHVTNFHSNFFYIRDLKHRTSTREVGSSARQVLVDVLNVLVLVDHVPIAFEEPSRREEPVHAHGPPRVDPACADAHLRQANAGKRGTKLRKVRPESLQKAWKASIERIR